MPTLKDKPYVKYVQTPSDSSPLIMLPTNKTTIDKIKLDVVTEIPTIYNNHIPQTLDDQIRENAKKIDIKRLNPKRITPGDGSYPLDRKAMEKMNLIKEGLKQDENLKDIAVSLGLKKTGSKKELISQIKSVIKKYYPEKFEDDNN